MLVVMVGAGVALLIVRHLPLHKPAAGYPRTRSVIHALVSDLDAYQLRYNRTISDWHDPLHYLDEVQRAELVEIGGIVDGQIVDGWNRALRFSTVSGGGVCVWSAGKNGIFGDDDDFRYPAEGVRK